MSAERPPRPAVPEASALAPRARAVAPIVGEGMVARAVRVGAADVVFVKGVIEASDGLACVFAERAGDLTIAAPSCLAAELDRVLDDLAAEVVMIRHDAAG